VLIEARRGKGKESGERVGDFEEREVEFWEETFFWTRGEKKKEWVSEGGREKKRARERERT